MFTAFLYDNIKKSQELIVLKVFNKEKSYKISREAAAEGMVLIKNTDNALPFKKGEKIAVVGKGCFNFAHCGEGSADVYCAYTKTIIDGLKEKQDECKVILNKTALSIKDTNVYDDETITKIAEESDTILVSVVRNSGEAFDRKLIKGEFYLTDEEVTLFEQLQANENVKKIVVLLNYAGNYDMRFVEQYSKIKAALIIWLPGMEGGAAAADLLCGDKTPSGKLTHSIAQDYSDYPSSETFNNHETYVMYDEDIFVGYRYFETFEKAKQKVLYPFGYGLSYTSFELSDVALTTDDKKIYVSTTVKNTGKFLGKEVVQVYVSAPDGALSKPEIELKGYQKSKLLNIGEQEKITVEISVNSLASFDDTGVTGYQGAYVLEEGVYKVFVGTSSRDICNAGSFYIDETAAVENCGLKMSSPKSRRLEKQGYKPQRISKMPYETNYECERFNKTEPIMLKDVADGKASIKQFLSQLTVEELISLSYSQPPTVVRGTAGIGNLRKYGVPNVQTADGPNGIRQSTHTTCFPCAMLLGCSFDDNVQFTVGRSIAEEGLALGVDILLAPGLCIQRDPLCGRNFEYYSEDPFVSGRAAAAFVQGVQSCGMLATIKHFCCNNKEENRFWSNSIVSERALREIYLKGFEIAVKTAAPAFVMTSYNFVNSTRTSCNYGLINGILRGEWGFSGAVMTDWRVPSHHYEEVLSGNNIKMPYGYPEELALTKKKYDEGIISREVLENNVKTVLEAIMKTNMFSNGDMGIQYVISNGITRLWATDFTGVTGTWLGFIKCEDDGNNGYCLSRTSKDLKGNDVAVYYDVVIEQEGDYDIYFRVDTEFSSSWLELNIDNVPVCINGHIATRGSGEKQRWVTLKSSAVNLPSGNHEIKIFVRDTQFDKGINLNWFEFVKR